MVHRQDVLGIFGARGVAAALSSLTTRSCRLPGWWSRWRSSTAPLESTDRSDLMSHSRLVANSGEQVEIEGGKEDVESFALDLAALFLPELEQCDQPAHERSGEDASPQIV